MSFRDNLQYLRAQRNMTQEQLAMLLGVSRQAISKWESDKAYPEMDKLLMICDLFGVTLDDLVIGDVRTPVTHAETAHREDTDGTQPPKAATGAGMPPLPEPSALPQDITGYDEHMRSFDRRISAGVFAAIFGVGVALLFTGEHALPTSPSFGDFLVFLCIAIGVLVALAFLILADSALHIDEGWPTALFMMIIAGGVAACTFGGMNYARIDVAAYNKEAVREERSRHMDTMEGLNGAICGTIMILATIAGLSMLFFFDGGPNGMFWMSWVIGGLLCGISSIVTNAIAERDTKR